MAKNNESKHPSDMKSKQRTSQKNSDRGISTFDSFLEDEGIRTGVAAVASSQLDRLLDPQKVSVTIQTIARAARALGKLIIICVADVKMKRA